MIEPMQFDFDGWPVGKTPVELFDAGLWLECLHATMQAFNIANDPHATQRAIADNGVLHELAHLALELDICTHHESGELREALAEVSQ